MCILTYIYIYTQTFRKMKIRKIVVLHYQTILLLLLLLYNKRSECGACSSSTVPIAGGPWYGAGRVAFAVVNDIGGSGGSFSAVSVAKLALSSVVNRSVAVLERNFSLSSNSGSARRTTLVAFRFRVLCNGAASECLRTSLNVSVAVDGANGSKYMGVVHSQKAFTAPASWLSVVTAYTGVDSSALSATVQFRAALVTGVGTSELWVNAVRLMDGVGTWVVGDSSNLQLMPSAESLLYVPYAGIAYNKMVSSATVVRLGAGNWLESVTRTIFGIDIQYYIFVWARTDDVAINSVGLAINSSSVLSNQTIQNEYAVTVSISSTWNQYYFPVLSPTQLRLTAVGGSAYLSLPHVVINEPAVGCQKCLVGYWCAGQHIYQCPDKTTSASGSKSQLDCLCVAGYYGVGKQLVNMSLMNLSSLTSYTPCSLCPVNYYCSGNGALARVCPNGMKADAGSSACVMSDTNEVSAAGVVSPCPFFSHAPPGSSNIADCRCDDGYYNTAALAAAVPVVCGLCTVGAFCNNGSINTCPLLTTSAIGAVGLGDCFCVRGYYFVVSDNNTQQCAKCPPGSWCWTGVRNTCPFNSWSLEMSSYATACFCVAGYVGPMGGPCVPCSMGSYRAFNSSGRNPTIADTTYTNCTQCGVGQYSVVTGATSSNVCSSCVPGTYNPLNGQFACLPCSSGYYSRRSGLTSCASCWAGSYSHEGMSTCIACSMGTKSTVVAADSSVVCEPCPVGSWSPGNTTVCIDCGTCYYWDWPRKYSVYTNVMVDVTSVGLSYKYKLCYYSKGVAMIEFRTLYLLDLTSGNVTNLQVSFPGNGFSSITGLATSSYMYAIQPPNLFRVNMNMGLWDIIYPVSFPQGVLIDNTCLWVAQSDGVRGLDPELTVLLYFFPMAGGGATGVCKMNGNDNIFLFVTTSTQGLKRITISDGSIATLSSMLSLAFCRFTADNRFILLTQSSTSQLWAYSMYDGALTKIMSNAPIDDILVVDNKTVVVAISGQGVKNLTIDTRDSNDCSPGKYSLYSGLQSEGQCTLCPAGSLCAGGAAISQCMPGTYSLRLGLRSQPQCSVCEAGYYCLGGAQKLVCPVGSYSLGTGLTDVTDCLHCPAGYYCSNTTTITRCPANTMSAAMSADFGDCKCVPGFMCEFTKVIHVEVVLPLQLASFTSDLRRAYVQALATAAGVSVGSVSIVSVAEVTVVSNGLNRRRNRVLMGLFAGEVSTKAAHYHSNEKHGSLVHEFHVMVPQQHKSQLLGQEVAESMSVGIDVHVSMYDVTHDVSMDSLSTHLVQKGLPQHYSVKLAVHREIKKAVRVV